MKIDEGLLLCGVSVPIRGLGSIHSPLLSNIYSGIESLSSYNIIHTILVCSRTKMNDLIKSIGISSDYDDLSDLDYDEASKFDLIVHSPTLRGIFQEGLALFFDEKVAYLEQVNGFAILDEQGNFVGLITEANYAETEFLLKQTLYSQEEDNTNVKFASQTAKEWWDEANIREAEEPASSSEDYHIPNIISKLSCANIGYTIFSIYGLTVYQLYDQFYAYSQSRVSALGENVYANHGGEDFDHLSWLHKNKKVK